MNSSKTRWGLLIPSVVITVLVLLPMFYMILISLTASKDLFAMIPKSYTVEYYLKVILDPKLARMFLNSWIVCSSVVVVSLVLSSLAAYGLSRSRFAGKRILIMVFLITQIPPPILLAISYFPFTRRVGLYNTYTILVLLNTAYALPFSMMMLKKYFDAIPTELNEAAIIDGCSELDAFIRVIFPLAWPGIAAVAMFSFLTGWKEFLYGLTLTSTVFRRPITVGISMFLAQYETGWNELMAVSVWASVPVIVLFVLLQKYFIAGLTSGALKG